MEKPVRAGIVGVSGYTGIELLRLLAAHPRMIVTRATSRADAGKTVAQAHPAFYRIPEDALVITAPDMEDLGESCDIVFLAVPHGAAVELAARLAQTSVKIVDLSADFRLRDPKVYEEWYKTPHTAGALLKEAVYGLPELYRDAIRKARLVANPGCYPTAAILGLAPAVKNGLVETDDLIINAVSGASGAGRGAKAANLFCEIQDSFRPYGLASHRHTPEIEQEISLLAGKDVRLSFNPHLAPMSRGILETIYCRLRPGVSERQARDAYAAACENTPWVRLLPQGRLPETRFVRGSMFCDIGLVHDPRTGRLIIASAIDNLCRGASGQALANANLMCGLPEGEGLPAAPMSI